MTDGGGRKPYTGYGRELRRLMAERDIHSWTQLEDVIERATGRRYSHQSMSKYAQGTRPIPREFVLDAAAALDLTPEERARYADRHTFDSLPPANEGNEATPT